MFIYQLTDSSLLKNGLNLELITFHKSRVIWLVARVSFRNISVLHAAN